MEAPPPPYSGLDKAEITTGLQRMLLGVPWIFIFFASFTTFSRIWARTIKRQGFGWDDGLCLFALIIGWGLQISNTLSIVYGGSTLYFFDLSMAQWLVFFKTIGANLLLWVSGVAVLQLSIISLYLRVFGIKAAFRYACYVGIGLVVAWWIASFFVILFECDPVSHVWEPWKPGTCINVKAMCGGTGVSHIILDFLILLLPIPLVAQLQMSGANKVVIIGLFATGLIATICSILRVDCLVALVKYDPNNPTGTLWLPTFLEILEINIGVFCISVPTLAPVWTATKHSRAGSYIRSLLRRTRTTEHTDQSDPANRTMENPTSGSVSSNDRAKESRSSGGQAEKPFSPLDAHDGYESKRNQYELRRIDDV